MSSFDTLWTDMKLANAGLNDDSGKLKISVQALRTLLKRAFDKGYEHRNSLGEKLDGSRDIIDSMFGMR